MKKQIFIALFAGSLTLPTILFPSVRKSLDPTNYENRELASFPELSLKNLMHIPAEFEAWYNDHVPFKSLLVKEKRKIDIHLLGQEVIDSVSVGRDGWLFFTESDEGCDALADFQRTNLYTDEKTEELIRRISFVNRSMKERGIRFAAFIAPNKESIYGQYMPDRIRQFGSVSRVEAVVPRLQEAGLPVYDLKPALMEYADQYQVFFKADTHWNDFGAFAASQAVSRILLGSSVPLESVSVKQASQFSGDLARMLNMTDEYNEDFFYEFDGYLPEVSAECVYDNGMETLTVFESDSPNDQTLFVLGDSFSQMLKRYLPRLYRRTVFATFDTYESGMEEEYGADDFIYLTVERNQDLFERMDEICGPDS